MNGYLRKRLKITAIIIFTILLASVNENLCTAQVKKDTLKILFVGNSYTYYENLPQIVSIISDSAKTKLLTKKSVIGGATLSEHWRGARGLKTKEKIRNGKFDIVVLQEFSMGAIDEPDSAMVYFKLFCNFIKDNGARPYLYLTWAREKVPQYQEKINKVYTDAAIANKAVIVPAGKAWALARQLRPNIELYDADGSHPSKLGAFLTACVFVETFLGEIPSKLPEFYSTSDIEKESIELMNFDPLDVIFCRKIAESISRTK
jgi:hypothetical protein